MKYTYIIVFVLMSIQGMGKQGHVSIHSIGYDTHSYHTEHINNRGVSEQDSTIFAKEIIQNILDVVGLKPNFEIRSAKISNAAAVNYGGKRFILYDPAFINRIRNATQTDWAAISILAHEIGHHLNGHTMLAKGGNPSLELEADEFSGFVLRKMGATLEEAQRAMKIISNEKGSATHPKRSLRLSAIAKGYHSANTQLIAAANLVNPHKNETATVSQRNLTNGFHLDWGTIIGEVHLNYLPDRTFYLTKNLDFVEVTEKGIEVLGDIKKTRTNSLQLNIFDEGTNLKLNISPKGYLYNENNNIVGYLRGPVA